MRRRNPQKRPWLRSHRAEILVCLGLMALTWGVFGQTLGHDFVNYDDRVYITQNAHVNGGLSIAGIKWAFTHAHAGNWHPLTTISHMTDCQLFDLDPRAHHFVNVLLHSAAVVLLFLFLLTATAPGRPDNSWRCAFVAAVFAIHPLRVESVAWMAERKDVLSAFFFMLTLVAYARYVRGPTRRRYLAVILFCAGALLSKPMVVTLPLVLLVLDYWPFNRVTKVREVPRLLIEKLPFFVMSAAISIITFVVQEHSPGSIAQLPLAWRIENALVSYVIYIWQIIWPIGLAVFYPHPENHLAVWQIGGSALLLAAVTIAAIRLRLTRPYLLFGWLWYLIMLLPVIGIIEVGLQGHADRYTYLPHIGLYIAITWGIADLAATRPNRVRALAAAAAVTLVFFTACAWRQTSYWKNSETLWTHALAVTPHSDVAHTNMGIVLMDGGKMEEAIGHLQTALEIRSQSTHSHYDLSLALIHANLGAAYARTGRLDGGIEELRKAIEFQPDYPDAHYNLGSLLFQKGDLDGAMAEYRKVLSLRPDDVEAHTSLGNVLAQKGDLRAAVHEYEEGLKTAPHEVLAANNLAWILATAPDDSMRDGKKAVTLARTADQYSDGTNPIFIRTLAAAYGETGLFADAIATTQIAIQFAQQQGQIDFVHELENDIDGYRRNRPLRDSSLSNAH